MGKKIKNPNILIKKIIITTIGLFIMAQGVSLFLMSGVGLDPISVFLDGVTHQTGVSFGTAQSLLNVFMITIAVISCRKYIGASTIVALFLMGPFFDLIMWLEGGIITPEIGLAAKVLIIIVGQTLFSLGVALYLSTNMGGSPADTPGVAISERMKWTYGKVRIGADATYFTVGWIMGGTIGIGTIICVLLTGPIAQIFKPYCIRFTRRISEGKR